MSESDVKRGVALCQLITNRTGIVIYDHQISTLHDTLKKACARFGYADVDAYYQALLDKPDPSPEFEFLVANITVGESYFFRDPAQMALLHDTLLPEMIAKKRLDQDFSLRIWSAGCACGQEIYSIAILLNELLPDINLWTLHFLATDINTDALVSASHGRYPRWSLRTTPPSILQSYFTMVGDEYVLNEAIRQRVKFSYLNLSDNSFPSPLTQTFALDLILCRNVLIYIDPAVAQQIMQRFSDCLVPQGILLLGASDHVSGPTGTLNYIQSSDTAYYKQRLPVDLDAQCLASLLIPVLPMEKKQTYADLPLKKASPAVSVPVLQAKANALANLGRVTEALMACEQALKLDPINKYTFLIQGIVQMEQEKLTEAEVALRKAIYLDHRFIEAHYQLGLLLLHTGRREAALKCMKIALDLAEEGDPEREIPNTPGMTYVRFAEMMRKELVVYANFTPRDRRRFVRSKQDKGSR